MPADNYMQSASRLAHRVIPSTVCISYYAIPLRSNCFAMSRDDGECYDFFVDQTTEGKL